MLTVLWPEDFTVLDIPVCGELAYAKNGRFTEVQVLGAIRWPSEPSLRYFFQ
jgi:hypothetical protein